MKIPTVCHIMVIVLFVSPIGSHGFTLSAPRRYVNPRHDLVIGNFTVAQNVYFLGAPQLSFDADRI